MFGYKKSIKCLTVAILSIINLICYSLLWIKYGIDSFGWMVWGFSHYFTFFVTIAFVEKLAKPLINKHRIIFLSISILLIIAIFVNGFYVSTLTLSTINLLLACICYAMLSLCLIITILLFSKYGKEKPKEKTEVIKRDIETDILSFYIKDLQDKEGQKAVKLGFALIAFLIVYLFIIAYIVFVNIVAKNVNFIHIIVASVFGLIAVVFNQLQIHLTSKNLFISSLLENGLLIISLVLYVIIEWIFLPVTFNFLLVVASLILIIPTHIKFGIIADTYRKYYYK